MNTLIYAYTIASAVAEKFETIVSLAYDNSRFKDFYDIYVIAHEYDFKGETLVEAVKETFNHRNTSLNDIVAFEDGFSDDKIRQSRWNSFVKKKKATLKISMEEAITTIQRLMQPVVENINNGKILDSKWDHESQRWI